MFWAEAGCLSPKYHLLQAKLPKVLQVGVSRCCRDRFYRDQVFPGVVGIGFIGIWFCPGVVGIGFIGIRFYARAQWLDTVNQSCRQSRKCCPTRQCSLQLAFQALLSQKVPEWDLRQSMHSGLECCLTPNWSGSQFQEPYIQRIECLERMEPSNKAHSYC